MHADSVRSGPRPSEVLDEGVLLCSGGYDNVIKVWSAYSGTCHQRSLSHTESQVNCLHITPDRSYFVAGGYQCVRLYDINSKNNNPTVTYDGILKNVTSLGSHEDFSFMFTTGEDGSARIWDPKDSRGGSQCHRMFEAKAPLNFGVLHPNQTCLFVSDQQGSIYMWDLRNNYNDTIVLNKESSIQCVDIDAQARYACAVDNKGFMYFMRLDEPVGEKSPFFNEFRTSLKIAAHSKYGLKCKFSPDGQSVVTTSADTTAKVWDVLELERRLDEQCSLNVDEMEFKEASMEPKMVLKRENVQRWVWDLAFTMDSENLFTASSDNMVRLWNLKSGEVVREYTGHTKAVIALAFMDKPVE
ncbi:target of rapamycin complex subunit LST8 [Galendromus occidentalis]|uniref:Target of rapamycin complex subunit lst8 n=1 Tax=Galendromus occidentalis TaxID=34638 RepID=A0AAJ6QVR0_9ACAR|nr:target of rapamycin complex subunit LST8 [Galendromus occidentalis]